MGRKLSYCKEQALASALRLFCAFGYEKMCMRDMAHALKVPVACLYHSFGDKENLLLDVLGFYAEQGFRPALSMMRSNTDSLDGIRTYFAITLHPIQEEGLREGCIILHAATELPETAPRAAALARRLLQETHTAFADVVAAGQTAGQIIQDHTADFFASHLMATLLAIKNWRRMGVPQEKLEAYVAEAVGMLGIRN